MHVRDGGDLFELKFLKSCDLGAGAIIAVNAGVHATVGIFTCWIALFAPGILLIYGVMPWWGVFRNFQVYRRCASPQPWDLCYHIMTVPAGHARACLT